MRHGRRILLLEDDPDEARRSQQALVENGYAVTVAPSLEAARRTVEGDAHFDVVFVDHHLPDGEGPRIIPYLRAHGIQAPVVLLTGNRSERVAEEAFEAGCVDTAIKDVNYHTWLPAMADAFADGPEPTAEGARWGPHVQGVAVGRVHGQAVHGKPAELWAPYAGALASATELAIRSVRATGASLLGSLPLVHTQVRPDLHLFLVMRGGVFAAALMTRPPMEEDARELLGEAMAFGKARSDSDEPSVGAG
ncbi:MAG: response regulator [Thermoplasmatota archaeon]